MHGLEPAIQLQHHHATTTAVELQRSEGGPVGAHLEERWHHLWRRAAAHPQGVVLVRSLTEADVVALIEDRTSASHECVPGLPVSKQPLRVVVQRVGITPLTRRVGCDDHCKQWVAVHARVQLGDSFVDVVGGNRRSELAVAPCLVGVELGLGPLAPIFWSWVCTDWDHSQRAEQKQQWQEQCTRQNCHTHSVSCGMQGTTPFLGLVDWNAFRIQNTSPLSKA